MHGAGIDSRSPAARQHRYTGAKVTSTVSGKSTLARDLLPADLPCINARWEESELALLREGTGVTYGYGLATVTVIDRRRSRVRRAVRPGGRLPAQPRDATSVATDQYRLRCSE